MKREGRRGRWLPGLVALCHAPVFAGADVASVRCTPQESNCFSCPAARGRSIAVCGASGAVPQYRFGWPGAL